MAPPVVPCWAFLWKAAARLAVEPSISGSTALPGSSEPSIWPPGTSGDGMEHGGQGVHGRCPASPSFRVEFLLSARVSRGSNGWSAIDGVLKLLTSLGEPGYTAFYFGL